MISTRISPMVTSFFMASAHPVCAIGVASLSLRRVDAASSRLA
jgi:hypothetical protein